MNNNLSGNTPGNMSNPAHKHLKESQNESRAVHHFRLRILIIHRNFEAIYPLSCLLNNDAHNVQILAAEHLDEATRKIANSIFHLILVDINIDRRGIFHVVEALETNAPGVPSVLLIPDNMEEKADVLLERGFMDYILCNSDFHPGIIKRILRYARQIRNNEEQIAKLSHYDSLTGVANRHLFRDRLEHAVIRSQREHKNIGLLLLDIDRFHDINEAYGLEVGDYILKSAAERLGQNLRKQDTIARFGGDEFALILENLADIKDAGYIAQHLLDIFAEHFIIGQKPINTTLSIGIAIGAPDTPFDALTLLKHADIARYRAKEKQGPHFEYFAISLNEAIHNDIGIGKNLTDALERIFKNSPDEGSPQNDQQSQPGQ